MKEFKLDYEENEHIYRFLNQYNISLKDIKKIKTKHSNKKLFLYMHFHRIETSYSIIFDFDGDYCYINTFKFKTHIKGNGEKELIGTEIKEYYYGCWNTAIELINEI